MVEMTLLEEDIKYVASLPLPWEKLHNKKVLISGASGMIGSFLIHVLMTRNENIFVIAVGRNEETARKRLGDFWDNKNFCFISHDINTPLKDIEPADWIIHAASNTHPNAYAVDPVGTIMTNILGTKNMLDHAVLYGTERFLFTSSVEVYGENRKDVEYFQEDYCGYINCNTLRAGYPESKRAGESLCQAYRSKYGLDTVIVRLSRTYGPTMQQNDSKAIAQFIKNGVNGTDIILKSSGDQLYSYSYVADAVAGLITVLLLGGDGEAYNIADRGSDITLKQLAHLIARITGTHVKMQKPDSLEAVGYSKATKAIMNSDKIRHLGWEAHWEIDAGINRTLEFLKQCEK